MALGKMKYIVLVILVTQIISVTCFGENAGMNAARVVSRTLTEASKTIKDGMEQTRYVGYETIDLLLRNPFIKILIVVECCYIFFKTLQIVQQLTFNWRIILPIAMIIVGLSIFWPVFRYIAIPIVLLTIVIIFLKRGSFS